MGMVNTPIEERMGHLMIKNTESKEDPVARLASNQLYKKQMEAITAIATDYLDDQENEVTFNQAVNFFEQNCVGLTKQTKR